MNDISNIIDTYITKRGLTSTNMVISWAYIYSIYVYTNMLNISNIFLYINNYCCKLYGLLCTYQRMYICGTSGTMCIYI
jgi:hypothetical protein